MVTLDQVQEVPSGNMILLVGPPGSGKSTFCHQTVLKSVEVKPVVYVTTESAPSKVVDSLRQKGLGAVLPHPLTFVDAFHETVGLPREVQSDSVSVSSEDLTGMGIAILKLHEKMGGNFLLIFDSLTSPYLMTGSQILRFIRQVLSKVAAEGNAVLVCVDEGCGREEDLTAMMSMADGIVKIELRDSSKILNVTKYPNLDPMKIEVPLTWSAEVPYQLDMKTVTRYMSLVMGLAGGYPARTEVGDYVNLFWPNFMRWYCMLLDPKGFPSMIYDLYRRSEYYKNLKEMVSFFPWRTRLLLKFMPRNFDRVKDMRKFAMFLKRVVESDRSFIFEYDEDLSKTGEHYFTGHEHAACWGFGDVGATLGLGVLGVYAAFVTGFEKERRDWNMVETKCVGRGDPYCQVKAMPGEIDELKESLETINCKVLEMIRRRLMDRLMGFLIYGKPLWERPRLGDRISLNAFGHMVIPTITNEPYQVAMRLGGAVGGKEVGEHLIDANLREEEAVNRIMTLLDHCRVGKVRIGETIRIKENCESFIKRAESPSCQFTTGFLNGFFSAVMEKHVRETKCIAMGDPYCEWQFV